MGNSGLTFGANLAKKNPHWSILIIEVIKYSIIFNFKWKFVIFYLKKNIGCVDLNFEFKIKSYLKSFGLLQFAVWPRGTKKCDILKFIQNFKMYFI